MTTWRTHGHSQPPALNCERAPPRTIRAFDLNYRSKVQPDKDKARATNKTILGLCDVVVGNQDDFDGAKHTVSGSVSVSLFLFLTLMRDFSSPVSHRNQTH